MTRSEVFAQLQQMGVTRARVHFYGGNDEGFCDGIELFTAEDELIPNQLDEYEGLGSSLCKPVYDTYGGFAGDFSVDGYCVWDVTTSRVSLTGQEEVPSYESFEKDV